MHASIVQLIHLKISQKKVIINEINNKQLNSLSIFGSDLLMKLKVLI
jgi:hypothetical protein